jgi:hypothetical protein
MFPLRNFNQILPKLNSYCLKEMEQNFYRDDFEQMLKDTSDEFRMYPSRKVWHSIYNDFHPDRKWPSFTVCLVLLTSILYIGISNNNNISKNSRKLLVHSINTAESSINQTADEATATSSVTTENSTNNPKVKTVTATNPDEEDEKRLLSSVYLGEDKKRYENLLPFFQSPTSLNEVNKGIQQTTVLPAFNGLPTNINDKSNLAKVIHIEQAKNFSSQPANPGIDEKLKFETEEVKNINAPSAESATKNKTISIEEKEWLEDYAFHNKKNKNKWKRNLSIQYYITPSVGYRDLYKNNDFEPALGGLLLRTSNTDIISQQAAVNLETGATLLFDLSKRLSFKTGLQLNLTNYVTNAHKLQHPSQTTVLMNDLNNNTIMPVAYNSNHGNVLGSNLTSLNNKTYQVSIPVGLNYKVAGSDKVKWLVAGTLQPTYTMGGNVYLISADNKNFVEDASMLRSWNLNSSFETFVSIKTASGVNINVGPQLRYQLISSYSKQYTYTEKLYNVGIKLGVTKKL